MAVSISHHKHATAMKNPLIKTIIGIGAAIAVVGCAHASDMAATTSTIPRTNLDGETPRMVSAFFGLDNALPPIASAFYAEAPGKDGMPVTFSRRVMGGPSVDPKAFTVRTRSGALLQDRKSVV